jgi:hypothetical protein
VEPPFAEPQRVLETGPHEAAERDPLRAAAEFESAPAVEGGAVPEGSWGVSPRASAETEPFRAADTGPRHAADTGPMHAADTGHRHAADTGPLHAADTGPLHAADTEPAPATSPVVVPAGATEGDESRLPIYDSLESDWFHRRGWPPQREPDDAFAAARDDLDVSVPEWTSVADEGWHAAEGLAAPSVGEMTPAGLPRRVPQANIVPGSVTARMQTAASPTLSAETTRERMASFQEGVRRARATIKTENPPEE